jgi:hypothetical protein
MLPTVLIAFDLSLAGGGDFFTLDDPIKGQLDFSPYGLAEEVTDVTSNVRSVSFRRGRSSETQAVDAGNANVVLDNRLRLFDPLASASISPYAPSIIPRKALYIELLGERVFSGQIEDWDLQYSTDGDSVSIAKTSDPFTLLTQQVYASGAGASGLTGAVILDSASAAGWPAGRFDLDVGTATIGPNTIDDDTNVLSYLQLIADSETGLLFIGKDGALTFRDRTSSLIRTTTLFADDGTGIPFTNIEIEYGTEFLYTRVEVEWTGGLVTAEDLVASETYGLTTFRQKTLLGTQPDAEDFAAFLVERYRNPTVRIRGLQVEINALTLAQQQALIDLDLGKIVFVRFTPNGIGEPIFRELAVDGIEHVISPGSHFVKFNLFEPFLRRFSGSVLGTSGTAGTVIGAEGNTGTIIGSSGTAGTVVGSEGNTGVIIGSSGTAGTVTGIKTVLFLLDFSELDGPDLLGA